METTTYILGKLYYFLSFPDQSQYSYAYDHNFPGASPPKQSLSAHYPPSATQSESDSAYVAPEESVVNKFMEDIHGKRTSMTYEVADEQSVAGFMDSLKKNQTLNGMPAGKLSSLILFTISFCCASKLFQGQAGCITYTLSL